MNRCALLVVALVSPLFLFACAAVPTIVSPHASRLLSSLKQKDSDLGSFRGIGTLKIAQKGGSQTSRVAWIGSGPQRLRVDALGALGVPMLTFLVNGPTLFLYTYQDNRCYKGGATARNISRFVSIPVRPEVLFSLLSGRAPLLPYHQAKAQALKEEGKWRLCLYRKWGRIIEKVWFKDDGRTTERVEVFDGWGDVEYTVKFSEFEETQGFRIPHKIMISHRKGFLSLRIDRFWTRVAIPVGAYTLEISDAEVVDLDS